MSSVKYNVSKTYLLPLVSELISIETRFINNLENTYMFDSNNEYHECFYILHEFSFKNPEFTAYEHRLTNNELFVKHIDIGNKVLYIFKFPKEYLPEYYALQNGKYSEFGDDAKKLILDFWTQMYGKIPAGIREILKIKQILYKDKKLKEQLENNLSSNNHKVVLDDNQELGQFVSIENETCKLNEKE